jgi:hypothetical protein
MNKRNCSIYAVVIIALLIALGLAQSGNLASGSPQKDDATIQKCISDKFATSESLKRQGLSATVVSFWSVDPTRF